MKAALKTALFQARNVLIRINARIVMAIRTWLAVNHDMGNVSEDITKLADGYNTVNKTIFDMFHALPFAAGILSLTAKDAAKYTNPNVMEQNALLPLLISIVMAMRQGDSSLQINGVLSDDVRKELTFRGFKIEDTTGSNDNTGTFILWT